MLEIETKRVVEITDPWRQFSAKYIYVSFAADRELKKEKKRMKLDSSWRRGFGSGLTINVRVNAASTETKRAACELYCVRASRQSKLD